MKVVERARHAVGLPIKMTYIIHFYYGKMKNLLILAGMHVINILYGNDSSPKKRINLDNDSYNNIRNVEISFS